MAKIRILIWCSLEKSHPGMVYLNKCVFWHFSLLYILRTFLYMLKLSAFIYNFLPRYMECRRGLAMRILSISPSVCQTRALWQIGKKYLSRFLYHTKDTFSLVFWEEERLVRATPSTGIFGSTGPRLSEIADFEWRSLVAAPQP